MSKIAKEDLIRIHHYGTERFGEHQADKYFHSFFQYFEMIAERPYSFEAVDFIKAGYRRCVCGVDSIYYKINGDSVDIMTIIGRQEVDFIINQLPEE